MDEYSHSRNPMPVFILYMAEGTRKGIAVKLWVFKEALITLRNRRKSKRQ